MRRFTALYRDLDATNRSGEKQAILAAYFRDAPAADAAWALAFLSGRPATAKRPISSAQLRDWASEKSGIPAWLIDACRDDVGDQSETLALLLGDGPCSALPDAPPEPLHRFVDRLRNLGAAEGDKKKPILFDAWDSLDQLGKLVFHKFLSLTFRLGVQRKMLIRALADAASLDPAIIEQRLTGGFTPTAAAFAALLDPGTNPSADPARPFPFCLAHPLDAPPESLGDPALWQAEPKWDGIRVQIIRRPGVTLLWSRGEERLNDSFPDLAAAAAALPAHAVIDGEILAWDAAHARPFPFQVLQRRINRLQRDLLLFDDVPVRFLAYDLLELNGEDLRPQPLIGRRAALESFLSPHPSTHIHLSPTEPFTSWPDLAARRAASRSRAVEGLMLKRLDSPYATGRARGDWWKWKVDPYTIDAVMIYAQQGSGRRAGLFTDYTFALWHNGALVPIAKAYSGLDAAEIEQVNAWVRKHATAARGPVRTVPPEQVFELAFEGLQESTRHKSGIALRFPRIARWRRDKKPQDADTLESLRALMTAPPR